MLKDRILWGVILAVAVVIIALIDSFWLNFVVFGVLLYFAFEEAKRLFNAQQGQIAFVLIAFVLASISKEPLAFAALLLLLVLGYLVYIKADTLKEALPYLYPTVPIFALWELYLDKGIFVLFWLIFIVVVCDTSAYFIGKLIGTTPLSPTSASKTREGVIGGLICATVLGMLFGLFQYGFFISLIAAFFVAVFAIIGDLIESYFKRKADLKDSGELIPGHGGILDRIDAIIITPFVLIALL